MPHLPAEEAPGSPPLGQLMGRLAGRVAVIFWRLIQAHQIVQEVHLSSTGVTMASCSTYCRLMLLLGMQGPLLGNTILTGKHSVACETMVTFILRSCKRADAHQVARMQKLQVEEQ